MAKRQRVPRRQPTRAPAAARGVAPAAPDVIDVTEQSLPNAPFPSLHDLFNQQIRDVLDQADLDETQRQEILVAMSCPCCGGAAGSFSVKLKRRS